MPAISLIALSYSVDAFAESETIFSEDTVITDDITITSGETWIVESDVTLSIQPSTRIIFDTGSVLINNGLIENRDDFIIQIGAILNNKGTINNYDMFEIEGTLNNMDTGIINNSGNTEFLIVGEVGILNNDGLIENRDNFTIQRGSTLNNKGTINNYHWFENEGTLNNMDTGIIHNNPESELAIRISSDIQNKGIINNNGVIENRGVFEHYNGLLKGESVIHIQPDEFLESETSETSPLDEFLQNIQNFFAELFA